MHDDLTQPQRAVLDFLMDRFQRDMSPTYREICKQFHYRSPKAAWDLVAVLVRKGYLSRDRKRARGLRLTKKATGIPVIGRIAAGYAQETSVAIPEQLVFALESFGIQDQRKAFALRVVGDSMTGRQIFEGDLVLLEREVMPKHGDIVAALIDNESALKTLVRQNGKAWLRAENPSFPDLIPAWDLHIQGVARAVFHLLRL